MTETDVVEPPKPTSWYVDFTNAIGTILFSPTKFFTAMPVTGRLGYALTFGLTIHWIGSIAQFFFSETFAQNIEELIKRFGAMSGNDSAATMFDRLKDPNVMLFLKLGPVLADPITTVVEIMVSAAIIYVATRLMVDAGKDGAPDEHRFETVAKIFAYSKVSYVFYLVPFVGNFLAPIWSFVTLVKGIKAVYRLSTIRTLLIVSFPALFIGGLMLIGLFAFLLLGFKAVTGFLTGGF